MRYMWPQLAPVSSLTAPPQVDKGNGLKLARTALEYKRNFLGVSTDIMEHVDPSLYGDPKTAAIKLGGGT